MSSPAVETTGMHPLATRRELRRQRRERRLLAALAVVILTALLAVAAVMVDSRHHPTPVSHFPGIISVRPAASAL
jgi:heme A synthase